MLNEDKMKKITIQDFLTDDEIKLAIKLGKAKEIAEQITKPNMERIDRALGQKNDPMYLAYAIEYAISQGAQK